MIKYKFRFHIRFSHRVNSSLPNEWFWLPAVWMAPVTLSCASWWFSPPRVSGSCISVPIRVCCGTPPGGRMYSGIFCAFDTRLSVWRQGCGRWTKSYNSGAQLSIWNYLQSETSQQEIKIVPKSKNQPKTVPLLLHPWITNETLRYVTWCTRTRNISIVTARKRSLGQGNVFTLVCHCVHRGRVSAQGGLCLGASLSKVVRVTTPLYGKERVVCILLVIRSGKCLTLLDLLILTILNLYGI